MSKVYKDAMIHLSTVQVSHLLSFRYHSGYVHCGLLLNFYVLGDLRNQAWNL